MIYQRDKSINYFTGLHLVNAETIYYDYCPCTLHKYIKKYRNKKAFLAELKKLV